MDERKPQQAVRGLMQPFAKRGRTSTRSRSCVNGQNDATNSSIQFHVIILSNKYGGNFCGWYKVLLSLRRKFKRISITKTVFRNTLILIFSQNMDEFEKPVQTLESVHQVYPPSLNWQTSWLKKLGCASYFQPAWNVFRNQRKNRLTRVWTITSYIPINKKMCSVRAVYTY